MEDPEVEEDESELRKKNLNDHEKLWEEDMREEKESKNYLCNHE